MPEVLKAGYSGIYFRDKLVIDEFLIKRYNGQVASPPGHFHESPTEYYLNTLQNSMANTNLAQSSQGNFIK